MNRFFADEIRTKSAQIRARGISEEGIDRILQAYRNIMKAAWIGRNDGLLDLEEFAINFDDGSAAGRMKIRPMCFGTVVFEGGHAYERTLPV